MLVTPREEIQSRLEKLRVLMEKASIDGAFFHYKIDYYYFTGTMQDVLLFVPLSSDPVLFVKRELTRARKESPVERAVPIRSVREVKPYVSGMKRVGIQLDVMPYNMVLKFKEDVLPQGVELVDVSPLSKKLRTSKSTFEIGLMKKAAAITRAVYTYIPQVLREGMREIELGGLLEAYAKPLGHEGLLRVRNLNYEPYTWHILSGRTGSIVSQSDSPMGGLGLSPAFPVGASMKKMKAGEPILVDFGIRYHGYHMDVTRMFAIGHMPDEYVRAHEVCKEIQFRVLDKALTGALSSELFKHGSRLAEEAGFGKYYLGYDHHKVNFLAHGIGIELAELPFIAGSHEYPVNEEGATFAIEPKMVFPGRGACGTENTVLIEKGRYRVLTDLDDVITVV